MGAVVRTAGGTRRPLRAAVTRSAGRPLSRLLGSSRGRMVALALVVGVGAGVGAVAFRYLIEGVTRLFTGVQRLRRAGPRRATRTCPGWAPCFVLLAPVVAGLLYGPLVQRFAREARGHGVPEVMVAVARHGGRIRPQVAVVKALASALCIGGGGSVGREGPIVQIGSALGSTLAQAAAARRAPGPAARGLRRCRRHRGHLQRAARRRVLRDGADPAALGGGVVRDGGAVVGHRQRDRSRRCSGNDPVPRPAAVRGRLTWCSTRCSPCSACIAGLVGVAFSRVLYAVEDACDWAWRGPGVAAPRCRRAAARRPAAPAPRDVRRRLPRAGQGRRRGLRRGLPAGPAGRQGGRLQPHHRDRRLRRGLRAQPVRRRDDRGGLRRRGARGRAAGRRAPWGRTPSSGWARSSPAPPGPRSPRW